MKTDVYDELVTKFGSRCRDAFLSVDERDKRQAREIRIRAGRPAELLTDNNRIIISNAVEAEKLIFSPEDIRALLSRLCDYSLYNRERELKNGFVTIDGGHRIGICGSYSASGVITHYSSLNIRISRQVFGCANALVKACFSRRICSLLLIGSPGCGKTTMLRDIARILSSDGYYLNVCIIDERGELASTHAGVCGCDVGVTSDVLNGYPKTVGIDCAIRTMAPDIIICDEIGSREDIAALQRARLSGVKIIASIHATSIADAHSKAGIYGVGLDTLFERSVLLDPREKGRVCGIDGIHGI